MRTMTRVAPQITRHFSQVHFSSAHLHLLPAARAIFGSHIEGAVVAQNGWLRIQEAAVSTFCQEPSLNGHRVSNVDIHALAAAIVDARGGCRRSGGPRSRREVTLGGEVVCSQCGQQKPLDFFGKNTSSTIGVSSKCRECARKYSYEWNRTLRGNFMQMVGNARRRAQIRGHKCDVELNGLLDLLWAQGGCCFYSGVPMECLIPNSHWRVSLERLDNGVGYEKHNCTLVACEFNTSDYSRSPGVKEVYGTAQWTRGKVHNVVRLRSTPLDILALTTDIDNARGDLRGGHHHRQSRQMNTVGNFRCNKCDSYKPEHDFYGTRYGLRSACKECIKAYTVAYQRTLRGKVRGLIGSARARGIVCTLTADDLLDMLWSQRGRCYYSGVTMEYSLPNSHWRMSLERLDNAQGYIIGNCVLIASEFNTGDYGRGAKTTDIFGSAQWSRSKADYIWGPFT